MVWFLKVNPNDQILMEQVYNIRYKVYCLECGYDDPLKYKNEVESDEYDVNSVHFIAINTSGVIGTARIVLDSDLGFPLEKHCRIDNQHAKPPRHQLAEISRLAVLKQYRSSEVCLGLWRAVYQESKRLGISYWYAVMEKKLLKLLKKFHIIFDQIGDRTEFMGTVFPFLAKINMLEYNMAKSKSELFNYFKTTEDNSFWAKLILNMHLTNIARHKPRNKIKYQADLMAA